MAKPVPGKIRYLNFEADCNIYGKYQPTFQLSYIALFFLAFLPFFNPDPNTLYQIRLSLYFNHSLHNSSFKVPIATN